jgi:class 3 adenylate cyclase
MAAAGGQAGTATVLFTDLVGSTTLRQTLGDDRADDLRRQHDRLLREAVTAHGGAEVKGTGDGLMVVFGSSAEATAAAIEMQRAVARFNRRAEAPIRIRIGISAGDVIWEDGDCFGTPVVEARRLCDAAEGDRILASEVVRLLAGSRGGHHFVPLPPMELKGLVDPVPAAEVSWEPDLDSGAPLPAPLSSAEAVPFVGRHTEREHLLRTWKEARAGARRVVLVSGEPGMGKTRLAAEVAAAAHDDGATVLFGRCDEDLGVPYQPFVEALDAYASTCPADELAEQVGAYGGDLARLVPRLSSRIPDLPEPLRAEPDTERYRLFEAVRTFLSAIADAAPVVLVLDDLHWAARPTLLLLRHVVRAEDQQRLLVIGTYRDTDLGRGHPLADMLADLRREQGVERIALRGLDEGEVGAFVEAASGQELGDDGASLAEAVHAETEGNPFFVGQVLRHLVESGALVQTEGRWARGVDADAIGIPEGVRDVIGRRLAHLADTTNDVLATAAVIGREFDADLLVASTTLDEEVAFDALEEAERARLITGVPERPGRYTFAHALVRSTLYDEISTTRRLRIHRRIGHALERRGGDRHVDELARHFCECAALGEIDRAVTYGRQAAARALERLAYEEAARGTTGC